MPRGSGVLVSVTFANLRQRHRPRDHLLRAVLRHRQQREKLVVRRRPDDVVRAGDDFRFRRAARAAAAGKRRQRLIGRLGAVRPHRAFGLAVVVRVHRRGRADDHFLRRQRQRLVRGVFQPHAGVDQIIRAEMKFLHQPQAAGENFFRADAVGGFRQRKIAVADQAGVAQHRERRHAAPACSAKPRRWFARRP